MATGGGEADGSLKSFSSFLATAGCPSPRGMAQLCDRLFQRQEMFQQLHVRTACLALLSGSYLSVTAMNQKDAQEVVVLAPTCKTLLQFMLTMLPECGDNFLPVFRYIHGFCTGDEILSPSDRTLLVEQMKLCKSSEEGGEKEEDSAAVPDKEEVDAGVLGKRTTSDPRADIQKLFSHMKTSRHDSDKPTKPRPWKESKGLRNPFAVAVSNPMKEVIIDVLKELDGWRTLHDFCKDLPIFRKLGEERTFLSACVTEAGKEGPSLDTLIERLHQIKSAVMAVSVLAHLICPPYLLLPPTSSILTSLTSLLTHCINAATAATCAVAGLKSDRKTPAGGPAAAATPSGEEGGGGGKTESPTPATSVAELLSLVSYCQTPSPPTVVTARTLAHDISTLTLKVFSKLLEVAKKLPGHKVNIVQNLHTVMVYRSLCGLVPLLALSGGSGAGGQGRGPPHVKLTVPLVKLATQAVQSTQAILEELSAETAEEPLVSGTALPSVAALVVTEHYSSWQCTQMLFSHLPLLKILFNLLTHSCKKTLALMSSQAAAATASTTDNTTRSQPIKTRNERQEKLARLLQESLSRKITEKVMVKEEERKEDGGEVGGSISPMSSVSSTGEREGGYTLYDDSQDSGDLSVDEDYEAPSTPPFMLPFPGDPLPMPPVPTSPPMPPKRRISVPLEPPQLKHKSFPDPPTHQSRGTGTTPEVQVPRFVELRKKPEFFLGLASATLKCLSAGIVQSEHTATQKLLQDKLRPEIVAQLAWLLLNVGSTYSANAATPVSSGLSLREKREAKKARLASSSLKQGLAIVGVNLLKMVHQMILNDSGQHMLHDVLLHELGLSAKCWSLAIPAPSLSVLACVLVCRLQRQNQEPAEGDGSKLTSDDQLAVSIWRGFLRAVAENACSSDEQDEDVGAPHMQLMLMVWHSFSCETRRALLTQCAQAVVTAAGANKSGVKLHPLAVSRLLLLLDYMLFQFSTPSPLLSEHVKHNLFTLGETSTPSSVSVYMCKQQLQYSTVLSKPHQSSVTPVSKEGRSSAVSSEVSPKFYNVRPFSLPSDELGEDVVDTGIDGEACKIVLQLPGTSEGVKGYNELCLAIVVLMSCGMDYARQTEDLQGRVLAANAVHKCFSLSVTLLRHLPPSYNALTSIVDGGQGLSCKDSVGGCMMVYAMYLSMRIKMQQIEPDDVTDTLVESEYSREEAEEILARVLSVVDSTDHIISQITAILEDFLSADEESAVLPLFCVIALDFLVCLLTRVVVDETEPDEDEEDEPGTTKTKLPAPPPPPPLPPTTHTNKNPSSTEAAAVEGASEQSYAISPKEAEFYAAHGEALVHILVKVASKLLVYCRLYAMIGNQPGANPPFLEPSLPVLDGILKLAGKNPLQSKDAKPLFHTHIPDEVRDRLKTWNTALLINPAHKEKLCSHDLDSPVSDLIVQFLNLHFCTLTGARTFDPTRCFKSALSSLMSLLSTLFDMVPPEIFSPPQDSKGPLPVAPKFMTDLVPLSCDVMMEYCASDILKLIKICGETAFSLGVSEYRLRESSKLLQLPKMRTCSLLGALLADFFLMLSSMLEDPASQPVLSMLTPDNTDCHVVKLVLLAGSPDTTAVAVIESLKFLSKLLTLAQNGEETRHLNGLIAQVNSLGCADQAKDLERWLKRLVLGSSSDGQSEVALSVSYLFKFVELLTIEDSMVCSEVDSSLFTTLLPLGDQLITEMNTQPKLLPVFVDYFQSLVLLAGTGNTRGHISLVQVVEKWFLECLGRFNSEADAVLLLKPQVSAPVATMLQYLGHLYSAVLFAIDMLKCNEKRKVAEEEDSPLMESDSEDEEEGEAPTKEDELSQGEESEGESLNNKLCTFTVTHKEYRHQHWYHCHTCGLVDGTGACSVCAKVCHKGHDVTYSKLGSFFCDCGAKEGGNCKALVKRSDDAKADTMASSHDASAMFSSIGRSRKKGRKRRRGGRREGKWTKVKTDNGDLERRKDKQKKSERKSSFPTLSTLRLIHQIEEYKIELCQYLDASPLCGHVRSIVARLLPRVVSSINFSSTYGCNSARQAMIDLHIRQKAVEYKDDLMAATLGSQEGAFENVRLSFQGDQGQQLRQLLSSNAVRRVAMCALSSVKGHRQHLAVNHDKGKITFLQLFPILRQTQSNRRKLTLTRLSTATVPFTVISVAHNPCHEDFMVVCGLKECQLLVLNSSAQVTSRAVLHPSVDTDGYIVKAVWVPGSQTELVVVTDTFVKIYDLQVDLISPVYYFVILTGKIKDATIAVAGEDKFVVVMSSTGTMYSQPVIPACNAVEGPVYFTIDLTVSYPPSTADGGSPAEEEGGEENAIFGGGVSIYYSHTLKMLFFSFMNGKSFMGSPNSSLTDLHLVVNIPLKANGSSAPSKGPGPALVQWTEVQHHPGLVCALCQNSNNPVVMLVKPEQIQVHELKALPNKAKVQGMVAMRQPPSSDASTHHRTTLIILCEDGSLRIYVANNNSNTEYWLQPQFKPSSPLVMLRGKRRRRALAGGRGTTKPKFPVDFFEHYQSLPFNDIEFGGTDVLHVYNRQQLKHRLNPNSLYVVNTKSSGFTMEVTNNNSGTVTMVGVRVMVGHKSIEKAPSFVEVFGRTHPVSFPASCHRWIDIPFTRDESLQADKLIKITFGPSQDPSGVNIVDSILVYGQTKSVFGWPEHANEVPTPAKPPPVSSGQLEEGEDDDEGRESMPVVSTRPLSHLGRMICDAFSVLGNHNLTVDRQKQPDLSKVIAEATSFLMYSVPWSLQYHMRFLLASMVQSRDQFHQFKDKIQLSHVIQALSSRRSSRHLHRGTSLSSDMEPEYFQYLLLMLLSIARHRPHSLATVAAELADLVQRDEGEGGDEGGASHSGSDGGGDRQGGGGEGRGEGEGDRDSERDDEDKETKVMVDFLKLLNDGFWQLYVLRCSNPAISPVINPGFTALDATVLAMTEIMWTFVHVNHNLVDPVLKHTIRFLLTPNSQMCEAALSVVTRMLKPRKKKEKTKELGEEVMSPEPVSTDDGHRTAEEDKERSATPSQAQPAEVPMEIEREGEGEGEGEGEREEGEGGREAGEGDWMDVMNESGQSPQVELENLLANPAAALQQISANPEQYLIGLQGAPDEEAMMNLAIALSLQEEVGGSPEANHALQVALQGLGLPVGALGALGGLVGNVGGEEADEGRQDGGENEEEQRLVHEDEEDEGEGEGEGGVGDGIREGQEREDDFDVPQVVSFDVGSAPSHRGEEEGGEGEGDGEERSRSNSEGSSIYAENVMREATATPSEVRVPTSPRAAQRHIRRTNHREPTVATGSTPEASQDPNSETEMVNYSTGEDDPGESDHTLVETLSQMESPSATVQSEGREEGGGVGGEREALDSPPRLAVLRKKVLRSLLEQLYRVELAGGMRSICFMKLILFIAEQLECNKEDCEALIHMLEIFLKQLHLDRENVSGMVERNRRNEVLLLYLRFFNILMSRKKIKQDETKPSYASNMLWFATARTLLSNPHLLQFCRQVLVVIMEKKQCLEVNEEPNPLTGAVLQPKFNPPLADLSPFFQRHYVKGTSDIFIAYGRLLAEITLVLPNQLRKMSEVTRHLPTPELGQQWTDTLCDFLLKVAQSTGVGRRHVRKLLLQLCGSKESYRLTRDVHALHSFMKNIREICHSRGFDPERVLGGMPLNLSYKSTLSLIEHLKACDEVACTRTSNWQTFCLEEKTTLPYLFQAVFLLDEGLAPLILQLVQIALSGIPPKTPEKEQPKKESGGGKRTGRHHDSKRENKEAKEARSKDSKPPTPTPAPDKEKCQALVQLFISYLNNETLLRFIRLFLLQPTASSLRWQAHTLLHTLYTHSNSQDQSRVVELLWQMWPDMPTYGWKASQFVDLLGYCTISTPHIMERETLCMSYVEKAIALLKTQNKMVATHPNSHIYSQLLSLVDFSGYYLENKPCLVCNDPEVPYDVKKLYQMKSEVRYSPNMILFKLTGSFTVSQVCLAISDVKRSKMVKTVNVYYSNRTMQNIIELKNKRNLWLKARSQVLSPGQTEVKIDFPLPIIACNIIIEFADFYENIQGGAEVLQCPRCQAAVSAHPGVCATCGENVYQCHKCRAINYDEKDPYLCNSCGFSKYAKFELTVEAKTCSAVDPIENEEDRKKTTAHISQLLEQADGMYKLLVQHRNELDSLLTSLASGMHVVSSGRVSSSSDSSGVHKGIQLVAQRYCHDCKTTYHDLSKVVQGVLASRKELVKYDQKKAELGALPSEPSTPALLSTPLASEESQCFGCSSAATEHCITLLKAFALKAQTRKQLVARNVIQELVDFNLRNGGPQMQHKIRELLCIVTRDDETATAELNKYVSDRVLQHITSSYSTPTLASMVRPEILLLTTSLSMEDSCWEQRLKTVVRLFRKSQESPSPAVTAAVTMPCLKIIQSLIDPKDPTTAKNKGKPLVEVSSVRGASDQLRMRARDWLREKPGTSFQSWKERTQQKNVCAMEKAELHSHRLAEKYATIWRNKTQKLSQFHSTLKQVSWLRSMLFNTSSQSARRATANILASLAHSEARQRQILDMLCSFLDEVTEAGEHAQEFLELLKKLIDDGSNRWKAYLALRGVLPKIGILIGKEIARLLELEETSLSSDLSQGYALKMLTTLLQSFLSVERIKLHFKGKLVGMVLDGYLSLRRLVIQRTKRVDETQELLLSMLEDLTSGAEEEREAFMALCVQSLNKLKKNDLVTPVFIFERLCNIIRPEVKDVGEFYLSLEKDPQQEEFLQGRMQGNPYPSSTPGLGPLMRDVKNKICTDCELVALLEDDTGMELLVCNKIVSLDLPVKEVFKKIWCAHANHGDCMRVVYRMRGLLGDATEDMVEKLDDGKDKNIDEEEAFKMAAVLSRCEGLDAVMWRLGCVRDFVQGHQIISAALKLLDCCTKLKVNRQYLLQPHLNAVNTLLGVFNLAVDYEDQHNTKLGAEVCEHVLEVTEKILQEASSNRPVLPRSLSQPSRGEEESESQLKTFLEHISAKFVQSNPSVRDRLLQIIPFLTFGDLDNMNTLLDYFSPHLDFDQFDAHASPETRTYFDCFCVVTNGIGSDPSGNKLKELIIEKGITLLAVTYLKTKVPPKLTSVDSSEWQECLTLPSVPYVLRMLAGLCKQHTATQLATLTAIEKVHLLEQVSTELHIGTLAENVLETMMDNPDCQAEIKEVRKATRQEKKRKAMALRKKELGALGMHVNEKGQVVAKSPLLKELGSLEEEAGLKCCICLEGYRSHPQKVLGVYTFSKKVTLDEFESKPRKTMGICTVSHFNVVHYDCHSSAVKLARGRDEWESAILQNANTKCNGLMPIWGPNISDSSFASSLARHTSYLQESTSIFDPSFLILAHDIRLLLLRFAYEKSFSAESGGGGPQSNLYLIPYLIHIAIYIFNSTRVFQREEKNLTALLSATTDKWVSSSYELDGPLYAVVASLFLQTLPQWKEHRLMFLRRLLVLAHARNSSSSPIKTLSNSDPVEYVVYKPVMVLFGLVDGLQHMLKVTIKAEGADMPHALLDYIRNNDIALLEGCDKLLSKYQDELLPTESFEEMCDVMGLDINQPYLTKLLASVSQK